MLIITTSTTMATSGCFSRHGIDLSTVQSVSSVLLLSEAGGRDEGEVTHNRNLLQRILRYVRTTRERAWCVLRETKGSALGAR